MVTSAGLVGGSLAAMASVDIVKSPVFGIAPRDPLTLFAAATLLAAIALIACPLPALRTTTTEPMGPRGRADAAHLILAELRWLRAD